MSLIKFFSIIIISSLVFVDFCTGEEAYDAPKFDLKYSKLNNGLQVVVVPHRRAPFVVHMVWYRVGGMDDPVGKSGLSHFLEHLMFKGTKDYPDGMFSKLVARNGGRENAFTSADFTGYFQRISSAKLPLVMELEADRMTNLVLTNEVVSLERSVVLEERSARIDNSPKAKFFEELNKLFYSDHPYGVPIVGWRSDIEGLDREDVLNFYRKHYTPENAIVVIVGDIEPEKAIDLARKYYQPIKPKNVQHKKIEYRIKQPTISRLELKSKRLSEATIVRFYPAPSYISGMSNIAPSLELLAEILGGNITSRLYRDLVVEKKLATSAGTFYNPVARELTKFGIYMSVLSGVDIKVAEQAFDNAIRLLLENGVTDLELNSAKKRLIQNFLYSLDSPTTIANIYGGALAVGMTPEEIDQWSLKIKNIQKTDIMRAANLVIDEKRSVTGILQPSTEYLR